MNHNGVGLHGHRCTCATCQPEEYVENMVKETTKGCVSPEEHREAVRNNWVSVEEYNKVIDILHHKTAQLEQTQMTCEALRQDRDECERQFQQAKQHTEMWKQASAIHVEDIKRLQEKLGVVQAQLSATYTQLNGANAQVKEARLERDQLAREADQLEENLKDAQNDLDKYRVKVVEADLQGMAWKDKYEQAQAEAAAAVDALEDLGCHSAVCERTLDTEGCRCGYTEALNGTAAKALLEDLEGLRQENHEYETVNEKQAERIRGLEAEAAAVYQQATETCREWRDRVDIRNRYGDDVVTCIAEDIERIDPGAAAKALLERLRVLETAVEAALENESWYKDQLEQLQMETRSMTELEVRLFQAKLDLEKELQDARIRLDERSKTGVLLQTLYYRWIDELRDENKALLERLEKAERFNGELSRQVGELQAVRDVADTAFKWLSDIATSGAIRSDEVHDLREILRTALDACQEKK